MRRGRPVFQQSRAPTILRSAVAGDTASISRVSIQRRHKRLCFCRHCPISDGHIWHGPVRSRKLGIGRFVILSPARGRFPGGRFALVRIVFLAHHGGAEWRQQRSASRSGLHEQHLIRRRDFFFREMTGPDFMQAWNFKMEGCVTR